jgi:IS30 family transposase
MYQYTREPRKSYGHFSLAERKEIAIGLEQGESKAHIARKLGRDRSSVGREIKRNSPPVNEVKYRANRAQLRADERKKQSHKRERLADLIVRRYIEFHLVKDGWTPAAIAGRQPLDLPGLKTNHESIYLWIYRERRDLIKHLVKGHKQRHKRLYAKKTRVSKIPNRIDLSARPCHIDKPKTNC